MSGGEEATVYYDIDDVEVNFNEVFIPWIERETDIVLGKLGNRFDFGYELRYPEAVHENGGQVDWVQQIHDFTVKDSMDLLTPKPGALEHFEAIHANGVRAASITSRPKEHRQVTEQLLRKHFGDYYTDFRWQLVMPDEIRENGKRPTKPAVVHRIGGIALLEDALHNLTPILSMDTEVSAIVFRDAITTWNHCNVPEGIQVAEGWEEATSKIGKLVIRR